MEKEVHNKQLLMSIPVEQQLFVIVFQWRLLVSWCMNLPSLKNSEAATSMPILILPVYPAFSMASTQSLIASSLFWKLGAKPPSSPTAVASRPYLALMADLRWWYVSEPIFMASEKLEAPVGRIMNSWNQLRTKSIKRVPNFYVLLRKNIRAFRRTQAKKKRDFCVNKKRQIWDSFATFKHTLWQFLHKYFNILFVFYHWNSLNSCYLLKIFMKLHSFRYMCMISSKAVKILKKLKKGIILGSIWKHQAKAELPYRL